jgi:hypothetical protein
VSDDLLKLRTEEFRTVAAELAGAERAVVLALRRELRAVGKPVGQRIVEAYGDAMPSGGGFADRVRSLARVSVLTDLRKGVRIQVANRGGVWMGGPESGALRHPVWGRRKGRWATTKVPAGVGAKAFEAEADHVRDEVVAAVTRSIRTELHA